MNDESARACVHSRLIAAPPAQVLRAIAEPHRLARWWGPDGFSSIFQSFAFQPGGRWIFTMHGPDGAAYPNENVFRETGPERVVVDHISDTHHFLLTITLTAQDGQTLVGWRQVFDSAEHKERVAPFVLPANEQNLDRLAAEVITER
jgi:uncharacterized protein YndB with AHSA1/START domain